jgi:tRNA(His) 5'-end guanylyltransferase
MQKPFDLKFIEAMVNTAKKLLDEIQGAKCAYIQSDEISLLLTDFDKLTTDAWFDYNIQKMCSIASGVASVEFTKQLGKTGVFDCRVFNIPKEEVTNYFIWRQKDWERNSLQMFAQSQFSTKQLHKKNKSDMHEMLHKKGLNWNDLEPRLKNGTLICNVNGGYLRTSFEEITNNRLSIDVLLIVTED